MKTYIKEIFSKTKKLISTLVKVLLVMLVIYIVAICSVICYKVITIELQEGSVAREVIKVESNLLKKVKK